LKRKPNFSLLWVVSFTKILENIILLFSRQVMAFIISAAPDGSSPAPVPSFRPAFEACGCFVECGGSGERELPLQILLLLRQDHKTEPNVWGVPGGKLHLSQVSLDASLHSPCSLSGDDERLVRAQGETAEAAMVRELEEETGLTLAALEEPHLRPCGRVCVRYACASGLDHCRILPHTRVAHHRVVVLIVVFFLTPVCRYPEVDFVYHMYRARLINHHTPPAIRIDSRYHFITTRSPSAVLRGTRWPRCVRARVCHRGGPANDGVCGKGSTRRTGGRRSRRLLGCRWCVARSNASNWPTPSIAIAINIHTNTKTNKAQTLARHHHHDQHQVKHERGDRAKAQPNIKLLLLLMNMVMMLNTKTFR
jgi:8-oxo-dGTP pyrophosphatase MutT (NUDIX family)